MCEQLILLCETSFGIGHISNDGNVIDTGLLRDSKPFRGGHCRVKLSVATHLVARVEKVDDNITFVGTADLNF